MWSRQCWTKAINFSRSNAFRREFCDLTNTAKLQFRAKVLPKQFQWWTLHGNHGRISCQHFRWTEEGKVELITGIIRDITAQLQSYDADWVFGRIAYHTGAWHWVRLHLQNFAESTRHRNTLWERASDCYCCVSRCTSWRGLDGVYSNLLVIAEA